MKKSFRNEDIQGKIIFMFNIIQIKQSYPFHCEKRGKLVNFAAQNPYAEGTFMPI